MRVSHRVYTAYTSKRPMFFFVAVIIYTFKCRVAVHLEKAVFLLLDD